MNMVWYRLRVSESQRHTPIKFFPSNPPGDYRLFSDGYVESLLTAQLNQEGVHVYVAKVWPLMKIKTDEGKEYYDLWFILEGRGANRGSVLHARCKCIGGRDRMYAHCGSNVCSGLVN